MALDFGYGDLTTAMMSLGGDMVKISLYMPSRYCTHVH